MNESQSDNYHGFASEYGDEDDFDYQEQLIMGGGVPNQASEDTSDYNNHYITSSNNPSIHQLQQQQQKPLIHSESIKMLPQDSSNKIKKINVKQENAAINSYSDRC